MQANTRCSLRVFATPTHLIVPSTQLQSAAAGTSSQLVIDCKNFQSRNMSNFNPFEQGAKCSDIRVYEAFGFVGLLKVDERATFALLITKTRSVGVFGMYEFFQVMKTAFVPAGTFEAREDTQRQLAGMKKVLERGFYYSRNYDLTQSLQKQHELAVGSFLHDHADSKFYWNRELYGDLLQQGADHKWFLPLIEGYVGIRKLTIAGTELTCALISRRACNSRYPRGLDDDGEVGNFVETEQLLLSANGTYFGLVLVRGTVPVFWEQAGPSSRFSLTRPKLQTAPVFADHMDTLLKAYQKVLIVNLLSSSKPHERVLSEAYREQMRLHQDRYEDTLSYLAYDYKAESKVGRLDELLTQASPMLLCHLYFSMQNKEILAWQKGVCRLNCWDCLDRTNAAMSRVAWFMLGWQVQALGKQLNIAFDGEGVPLAAFKSLWAENGDTLSLQYTVGAASLLLKGGKPGFLGLLEAGSSLDRLYSQAYEGHRRSEGFETLLGKFVLGSLTRTLQTQYIQRQTALREAEFLEAIETHMRVVTWNVNGQRPPASDTIASLLFSPGSEPVVIVLGLQELVPSSGSSQFQSTKNLTIIETWIQMIAVTFTRYCRVKYVMLKTDLQVGVLTLVYVQASAVAQVTSIDIDKVKTVGTRGAVALRFSLFHSSICLCNVNLPAETVEDRLGLLQEVELQAFQSEAVSKKQGQRVSSHEVVVLFGGLNFPLDCSLAEAQEVYREKGLTGLRAADQLIPLLGSSRPGLAGFKEAEIAFPPTVRFSALEALISESDIAPSWADRILYSGNCTVVETYRSVEIASEHWPVCADLLLRLRKVNEEKRQRVEKEEVAKAAHLDMSLSLEPDAHRRTVSHNL